MIPKYIICLFCNEKVFSQRKISMGPIFNCERCNANFFYFDALNKVLDFSVNFFIHDLKISLDCTIGNESFIVFYICEGLPRKSFFLLENQEAIDFLSQGLPQIKSKVETIINFL